MQKNSSVLGRIFEQLPKGSVIIHGACPSGADRDADSWASFLGLQVEAYPADWETHGKAAGPIRNKQMVNSKPDMVLAFWDGFSRGTGNCIRLAQKADIPVFINPDDQDQKLLEEINRNIAAQS